MFKSVSGVSAEPEQRGWCVYSLDLHHPLLCLPASQALFNEALPRRLAMSEPCLGPRLGREGAVNSRCEQVFACGD